jgi:hypothetical protein
MFSARGILGAAALASVRFARRELGGARKEPFETKRRAVGPRASLDGLL